MSPSSIINNMRDGLLTVEEAQKAMKELLKPVPLKEPAKNMGWVNKVRGNESSSR